MSKINLYKITNVEELKEKLTSYNVISNGQSPIIDQFQIGHSVTLFYQNDDTKSKELSWKWILDSFQIDSDGQIVGPKAVVLFESILGCYAATFGYSYFLVDKYCDRDYPFSIARRIEFENIKTTTLNSQSTTRNRMIYSYLECKQLEFESGEAYAKLKANSKLPESFSICKQSIQFGTSISFTTIANSLEAIAAFISWAENDILQKPEIHKIPVYSEIKQEEEIKVEETILINRLNESERQVIPREVEIVGTTEIFLDDYEYELRYERISHQTDTLSTESILQFMDENSITPRAEMLKVKIVLLKDGKSVSTRNVHDYLDYVNDNTRCLLLQGKWYRFNDDFINYLQDSINEIKTYHVAEYNLLENEYLMYIDNLYYADDNTLSINELKRKYYRERYFNIIRENDGFINCDRDISEYSGHKYEWCDLMDGNTFYTVKIGSGADKLTYAITQSMTSLSLIKSRPDISKFCLWFVLERETDLSLHEDGSPDINAISSISLKIQIDQWKKKVLLANKEPIIYINYYRH